MEINSLSPLQIVVKTNLVQSFPRLVTCTETLDGSEELEEIRDELTLRVRRLLFELLNMVPVDREPMKSAIRRNRFVVGGDYTEDDRGSGFMFLCEESLICSDLTAVTRQPIVLVSYIGPYENLDERELLELRDLEGSLASGFDHSAYLHTCPSGELLSFLSVLPRK